MSLYEPMVFTIFNHKTRENLFSAVLLYVVETIYSFQVFFLGFLFYVTYMLNTTRWVRKLCPYGSVRKAV